MLNIKYGDSLVSSFGNIIPEDKIDYKSGMHTVQHLNPRDSLNITDKSLKFVLDGEVYSPKQIGAR